MTDAPQTFSPDAKPLAIGMVLYPGLTLHDLAGPQLPLAMPGETPLSSKTLAPVQALQHQLDADVAT